MYTVTHNLLQEECYKQSILISHLYAHRLPQIHKLDLSFMTSIFSVYGF